MRLIIVVFIGIGLLSLTSCSETQHKPGLAQVEDSSTTLSQSDSDEESGVHSHVDVHTERGHQQHAASDHEHHGLAHTEHHGNAHSGESRHGQSQHTGGDRNGRSHSHGHQRGTDWHSADDHDASHNSKKIAIGDKVPDFEVTINGKQWKFSELQKNAAMTKDGTLVLTFWCSFCHSCRHVEHLLDELAKRYTGKVGVIALDASAGETTEDVREFAKERELTLPIALDSSGVTADIFGTRVTTTTVVIDHEGVLRYRGQFGDRQHAFAEDALRAVLAGEDVRVQETRQKG